MKILHSKFIILKKVKLYYETYARKFFLYQKLNKKGLFGESSQCSLLEKDKPKIRRKLLRMKTFTLVELLTVISIIAILASLLLPSLRKARDKAKQIQCLNNEKQLFFSCTSYANDFNGYSPPNIPPVPPFSSSTQWEQVLIDNGYLNVPSAILNPNGQLWTSPAGILNCPAESRLTANGLNEWNTWKGNQYGKNAYMHWIVGAVELCKSWPKMTRTPHPEKVAFLGDKSAGRQETFTGITDTLDKFRHFNGMNVYFVDGHGKWLKNFDVPHAEIDSASAKRAFWGRKDYLGAVDGW